MPSSTASTLRPTSAWLPLAMSAGAIATIAAQLILVGTARQPDEGAAAHLWQLLMAGQVPVILFYAVTRLPRAPRQALHVLAVQVGAAVAAAAPVFLLGW